MEMDEIVTMGIDDADAEQSSVDNRTAAFHRQAFVKLCDFGLAKKIVGLNTHTMTACLGTPAFMAPELVSESSNARYSPKSDVYSFGILLWCMATGKSPYEDMEISNIFSLMSEVVGGLRPTVTDELEQNTPFAALMQRCWLPEKDDRPDFEEILGELKALRDVELGAASAGAGYRGDMKRYFQVLRMKEEQTMKQQEKQRNRKRKPKKGAAAGGGNGSGDSSGDKPSPASKDPLSYTGPKNCRSGLSRQRSCSNSSVRSSRSARPSLSERKAEVKDRKMVSSIHSASREKMQAAKGVQSVLQQTMGGDFGAMREIVRLPAGVRKEEWLMLHMPDFYADVCVMYGLVCGDYGDDGSGGGGDSMCTEHTCPRMSAGPKFVWKDHEGHDIAAPIYIQKLLTWVQTEVNDPALFPTDADVDTLPPDTLPRVKIMMGLMFRVYAHLYHAHLSHLAEDEAHVHLNTCFKRFLFFAEEFELLSDQDLAPLQGVVLSMRTKEPWVPLRSLKTTEPPPMR
jgi:MOB kinase activator 1